MDIAQIAPLYEDVPPKLYGGTERVVAHLCDALVEQGHRVTLFAAADARTKADLVPSRDSAIRLDPSPLKSDVAAHLTMLHDVRQRAAQFDILHFHLDLIHYPMFEPLATRIVTTLHGRLDLKELPAVHARWPQFGLVSISNDQRKPLPRAHWLATVAHGLPPTLYPYCPQPRRNYLAFIGRMSPEKQPDRAIRIALRAGIPLKMAAKVDAVDIIYFDNVVRPLLAHPLVDFIGEIGDDFKADFLGNALALLFPIDWPEPFGLVMIEAMACGTPVIAWDRGSVAEVIEDGVSGCLVHSEEEAVAAIERVRHFERKRVRSAFEARFTSHTMARAYVEVYRKLLGTPSRAMSEVVSLT